MAGIIFQTNVLTNILCSNTVNDRIMMQGLK